MAVKPIPEGYHTMTPSAAMHDCARAIEFYKSVFGAQERARFSAPDGRVVHSELLIGDSTLMVGEPMEEPHNAHLMIYVDNCDAAFDRAVRAGATVKQKPADQFWGDRMGSVADPFGNVWSIATHVEDVSEAEMRRRFTAMMARTEQAAE